ncbi:MAG: hypothetical protein JWR29_211, partial [Tardiphaga sp.]|nr:hypothetical protein [Tardiphaga sp.]
NFVTELKATVPQFYDQVGQYLRAWQRTAPRLPESKAEPASVNTEAMRDAAEQELASTNQDRPVTPTVVLAAAEPVDE